MDSQSNREGEIHSQGYSESLACSSCQQDYEALSRRNCELKRECVRLSTFCTWEYGDVQNPRELAKWGLFYTGPADRVQCAFCHGVLKRWEKTDLPFNEHAKYFPRCKFVRGYDVGNIPIDSDTVYNGVTENNLTYNNGVVSSGGNSQTPQHYPGPTPVLNVIPQHNVQNGDFQDYYKNESNRLNSFSKWPPDRHQTPEVLSEAGFYHKATPDKPDRVRCAYCAGKLFNWQVDDDPWLEHARCFPQCKYVQLCLGPEVVRDLLGDREHRQKQKEITNGFHQDEHVPTNAPPSTTSSNVNLSERPQTTSSPQMIPEDRVSARMTSEPVQAVLQMGFPEQTVKQTVERCVRERPDNFPPAEELASILMEMEDPLPVETAESTPVVSPLQRLIAAQGQGTDLSARPLTSSTSREVTNPMSPHQRLIAFSGSDVRRETNIPNGEHIATSTGKERDEGTKKPQDVNKDKIKTENSKLKDQFLCKICMEGYVRVTFMPCGHLVCCASCSLTVSECPICRSPITGYVRTYF